MVGTNTGMSQRLARLRGGSHIATLPAASSDANTTSESQSVQRDAALKVGPLQKGKGDAGGAVSVPVRSRTFIELSSYEVDDLPDEIRPCPGFRLHDGQIWLAVTPQFLGWMSARITLGLRQDVASDDLGLAIELFHQARDMSGMKPVAVPADWTPPGLGRMAPADWDLGDEYRFGPPQRGQGGAGGKASVASNPRSSRVLFALET